MSNVDALSHRFANQSALRFKALGAGVVVMDIDNLLATATISLYGGHIVTWQPKHLADPVIWISKFAQFAPGKSIRGGIPVCWPWFGPHPTEAGLPSHGIARTSPWQVTSASTLANGATEIVLGIDKNAQACAQWSYSLRASLRVIVGDTLKVALTTVNEGERECIFSEALHTYLQVGDVTDVRVLGLEDCEYVDRLGDQKRERQVGPVTFTGETDRLYVNTTAANTIVDPCLKRRIRIEKSGSSSTVVWTPWVVKADRMGDFGADGWRHMVCVESANALDNMVTVRPDETHELVAIYSAEHL